jgi:WD40 repeat protein
MIPISDRAAPHAPALNVDTGAQDLTNRTQVGRKAFDAFISYSQAADGKLAPALQEALHRFAKPWYSLRAVHIFRDTTNLSANPNLWSSIQLALRNSEYLLLMASRAAAGSHWVPKELETFLEFSTPDKIILIQTDGELVWDESAGNFDWAKTTALPVLHQKIFSDEPLWVDLRWAHEYAHLDLRNPAFQGAVASISSTLRGIPLDVLIGRDIAEHRKTKRIAWTAAGSLAVLAGFLAVVSLVAVKEQHRAEQQTRVAVEQHKVAVSRQLAAEARLLFNGRLDLALLLAAEATRIMDTPEARGALLDALQSHPQVIRYLHGHTAPVTSVAFGPSDLLASGGRDGDASIRFWNVADGRSLGPPIRAEKWRVEVVAVSPDGRTLASAGDGGVIHLWDLGSGKSLRTIDAKLGLVVSLAFRPDGALFAGGFGSIRGWNPATGEPVTPSVRVHPDVADLGGGASETNSIDALCFSPDGKALISGAVDGTIRVSDPVSLKPMREPVKAHDGEVTSIAFHPDGRSLASSGHGKNGIRIWSWPDFKQLSPMTTVSGNRVLFKPNGTLLVAGGDGTIQQLDAQSLKSAGPDISAKQGRLWNAAIRGDGLLASAGDDGTIMLWNTLRSNSLSVNFPAHADDGIAFAPNGTLVTGGSDGVIRSWDVARQSVVSELARASRKDLRAIALSARNVLALGYDGGAMELIDLNTGKKAMDENTDPGGIAELAVSPTTELFVSAAFINGTLRVSQPSGIHLSPVVSANVGYSWDVAFSADGQVIAASGESGAIRLFRARDLHPMTDPIAANRMGMNFLAFSPDGRLISAGGRLPDLYNTIQARDGKNGRPLGPPVSAPPISRMGFLDGGKILAGGGFDGSIYLWDGPTLQYIGRVQAGRGVVRHLAVSVDGREVAASFDDGTAAVLNVDLHSWQDRARSLANRSLTSEERQRFLGDGVE